MEPTYPVVFGGLQGGHGGDGFGSIPFRFEINSFIDPLINNHAHDQLNLFVQAIERMQNVPREETTSWFQLGRMYMPCGKTSWSLTSKTNYRHSWRAVCGSGYRGSSAQTRRRLARSLQSWLRLFPYVD